MTQQPKGGGQVESDHVFSRHDPVSVMSAFIVSAMEALSSEDPATVYALQTTRSTNVFPDIRQALPTPISWLDRQMA